MFEPMTVEDQRLMYAKNKLVLVRLPETKRDRQVRAFNELRFIETHLDNYYGKKN